MQKIVEKNEIKKLRESQFGELNVNDLDIFMKRKILHLEGPYSTIFYNESPIACQHVAVATLDQSIRFMNTWLAKVRDHVAFPTSHLQGLAIVDIS